MYRLYFNDFVSSLHQIKGLLALLNKMHWKLSPSEMEKRLGEANDLVVDGFIYFDTEKEEYYFTN